MSRRSLLPDLVRDSRIETSVSGSTTKHTFYEPGRTPEERQRCRIECWDREIVLGSGAYGTVYRERRQEDSGAVQKLRAVKEIRKVVGEQLDYTRELEAVIKFSHPRYGHCFVRAEGWFEIGDSIFIAMEYIELGDLQKYLVGALPEIEVRDIIKQILEGIGFMHDNGFIHRDLKPGNIMVVVKGPRWYVKIADFGISKRRKHDLATLDTLQRGTLGFAAPEVLDPVMQQEGKPASYTFAVDIWSLGSLAYYMLTNRLVFDNVGLTVRYAMGGDFPIGRLKDIRASEKSQSFIKQMLAPNPESRPTAISAAAHEWLATPLTLRPGSSARLPITESKEYKNVLSDFSAASGSWDTEESRSRLQKLPSNYQRPSVQTLISDSIHNPPYNPPSDDRVVLEDALEMPRTAIRVGTPKVEKEDVPQKTLLSLQKFRQTFIIH
ncbi:unnamed protein product [Clonostachys rosea]|uniref:Protein kinase domain-containing protein n=1 Tax=Bionectria ochroleuca TaxID=29856 RepID=A0ABY6V0B8_BIOOC|nr:unnamed protein product [Clonostachys rosea]